MGECLLVPPCYRFNTMKRYIHSTQLASINIWLWFWSFCVQNDCRSRKRKRGNCTPLQPCCPARNQHVVTSFLRPQSTSNSRLSHTSWSSIQLPLQFIASKNLLAILSVSFYNGRRHTGPGQRKTQGWGRFTNARAPRPVDIDCDG